MTPELTALIATAGVWIVLHLVVAGSPLRRVLVAEIREPGFQGMFSLLSLAGLVALVMAYRSAAAPGVNFDLWVPGLAALWTPLIVMPVALLLIVGSLTTPNPTLVGMERVLQAPTPARGILRITRTRCCGASCCGPRRTRPPTGTRRRWCCSPRSPCRRWPACSASTASAPAGTRSAGSATPPSLRSSRSPPSPPAATSFVARRDRSVARRRGPPDRRRDRRRPPAGGRRVGAAVLLSVWTCPSRQPMMRTPRASGGPGPVRSTRRWPPSRRRSSSTRATPGRSTTPAGC